MCSRYYSRCPQNPPIFNAVFSMNINPLVPEIVVRVYIQDLYSKTEK